MTALNRRYVRPALLGALTATALLISACGSSQSKTGGVAAERAATKSGENLAWEKITSGEFAVPKKAGGEYSAEVGDGKMVHWKAGTKPSIAFFEQGESNTYLLANVKGAEESAKAAGASLTVFNANFQPATQRSQIQNAIASGKYNAAVVLPIESQGSCKQLTEELPGANIPVVVIAQQTCGRDRNSGAQLWSPGTVAWVGHDWPLFFKTWAENISKRMSSRTEAIMINGPEGLGVADVAEEEAKAAAAKNHNFDLVATIRTQYTTGEALTDTQNLLHAHPGVKAILVMYGGQAPGVISALKQAGKTGQVRIYDGSGGSAVEKTEIEKGELTSTLGQYPHTQSYCAVSMLVGLYEGKKVPRVVPNDCHVGEGAPNVENVTIYDEEDLAAFNPEY